MKMRDENDKNRQNSPLKRTKDSFFIDTSYISEKQVMTLRLKKLKKKLILFSHCINLKNFVKVSEYLRK